MVKEQTVIIKRNVEFIFSLIASILGFGSGVFVLAFGGLASVFGASSGIMVLGIAGIIFSIIGFVSCAIVKDQAKLAGTMMLVAGFGGAIVNGGFYLLPAIMFLIAGIIALVKHDKGYKFDNKEKMKVGITAVIGLILIIILANAGFGAESKTDKNQQNSDYLVEINGDSADSFSTDLINEVPEKDYPCVSLKQFPMTKYESSNPYSTSTIEYEVKYKLDYNYPNPEVEGFIVEPDFDLGYSDSVYCNKGTKTGENPNYWYCGTFKLTKNILDNDGTIKDKQIFNAKIVFDDQENYIKTMCFPNSWDFTEDWTKEVN
jgi:hypothetical protein